MVGSCVEPDSDQRTASGPRREPGVTEQQYHVSWTIVSPAADSRVEDVVPGCLSACEPALATARCARLHRRLLGLADPPPAEDRGRRRPAATGPGPECRSARPLFQEFYYWDTCLMCLGIYDTPREWLVIDAAENCASLIDRFGFIPNGTRYYLTSRSQPPFFTRLFRLAHHAKVRRHDPDSEDFLKRMTAAAVREHETCWIAEKHPHERKKYRGLSRYHDVNYSHFLASCESGWDHSISCDGDRPGPGRRWLDFVPARSTAFSMFANSTSNGPSIVWGP